MNNRGFTLLEILMVITIMGVLMTIVTVSFSTLNKSQALDKSVRQAAAIASQARSLTLSSKEDSNYGVHFEPTSVTLFKGSVYSPTDEANIVSNIHSLVTISNINLSGGGSDVVFERLSGYTSTPGTLTFSQGTSTKTLLISGTGVIEVSN